MKWFRNLRLATKISILSVQFIVFLMVIGLVGGFVLSQSNQDFKSLNNDRLVPLHNLEEAKSTLVDIRTFVKSFLTANPMSRGTIEMNILTSENTLSQKLDEYAHSNLTEDEKKKFDDLNTAYLAYKESYKTTLRLINEQQPEADINTSDSDGGTKFKIINDAFIDLIDTQIAMAETLYKENEARFNNSLLVFFVVIVVAILVGVFLTIMISRAVSKPIRKVTLKLKEISENGGDLRQRIGLTTKDEIGHLSKEFDSFMEHLQSMIADVSDSANMITSSSEQLSAATSETSKSMEQISAAINSVANGTTENMAVVQQTTAILKDAATFSEATAIASNKTSENSIKVKLAAGESSGQINGIVESMKNIAVSSKEVAITIQDLGESSRKINDIVKLITSIAKQTNLLALNAAIEAARAGEAGKGFSVVADEIQKLAERSSRSAGDIAALVEENQITVDKSIHSVAEVDNIVSLGVIKANEVKTNIDRIIVNINDIVDQITDIDSSVDKQAEITEEMNQSMDHISSNANDMSASTQEISASIEEQVSTLEEIEETIDKLTEMAEKLNIITSGFTV
jgi:methyl-accepting chemotaxis protein